MSTATVALPAEPASIRAERWDAFCVVVATCAYALATAKFETRDAVSTDTGAQAYIELALLGVSLLAAAIPTLRRQELYPHPTPLVGGLLAFGVLAIVSSMFSFWALLSVVKGCLFLAVVSIAFLLCTTRPPGVILRYLYLSLAALVFVALCVKLTSGEPLFDVDTYSGRMRFSLLAWHPIALADLAALMMLIGRLSTPRAHWTGQLMLFALVLLTGSRAVGACLVLVLAATALWQYRRDVRFVAFLGLSASILAFVAWIAVTMQVGLDSGRARGLVAGFYGDYFSDDISTLNGRTDVWSQSGSLLANTVIFGYGMDGTRAALISDFEWAGHSHNAYLELLLASGFPGLVCFMTAWGAAVFHVRKASAEAKPLLLGVHAYIFLGGLTDPNLTGLQCLSVFLLVCLDALVRSEAVGSETVRSEADRNEFGAATHLASDPSPT